MDFAKKQLEKYGWQQGQGLGINNQGTEKPIKGMIPLTSTVALKNNTHGLGNETDFSNTWWDHIYNKSSCNIEVCQTDEGTVEFNSLHGNKATMKQKEMLYGSFVKSKPIDEIEKDYSIKITDEDLVSFLFHIQFKACGGRSARKGARASQPGKLIRVLGCLDVTDTPIVCIDENGLDLSSDSKMKKSSQITQKIKKQKKSKNETYSVQIKDPIKKLKESKGCSIDLEVIPEIKLKPQPKKNKLSIE
jgi:hypothetical protein